MKKVILMMSVLLSCGLFCACSSDEGMNGSGNGNTDLIPDDGVVLTPITSEELFDIQNREGAIEREGGPKAGNILSNFYFFNGQLPIGIRAVNFFADSDNDECYVINSIQELKSIYCGDVELPELDFDKYTLVIGQIINSDFSYPILKQDLMFNDHKCHLTLYVPDYKGESTTNAPFYYWALYPKFYTEGISVGVVKESNAVKSVEGIEGVLWHNPYNTIGVCKYYIPLYDSHLIYQKDYGSLDSNNVYYPINLPDDIVVDEIDGTEIIFSGNIVKMNDDSQEALQIGNSYNGRSYFVYLTNIEVKDVDYDAGIPYRGVVPFTITDMPGMVGYDWDNDSWFITYVKDNTMVNRYYPKELSDEFKHPGLNVIISGNVYEDISKSKRYKHYKIELTKIEKAE